MTNANDVWHFEQAVHMVSITEDLDGFVVSNSRHLQSSRITSAPNRSFTTYPEAIDAALQDHMARPLVVISVRRDKTVEIARYD